MTTPASARPPLRGLARAFFDAAARGALALPHCRDCDALSWPPRGHCTRCESTAIEWRDASGSGRVHTFTVVRQAASPAFESQVPYVVAMIDLDEGPRLMSRIVDCDPARVRIGMRVTAAFVASDDAMIVPVFRPAGAEAR